MIMTFVFGSNQLDFKVKKEYRIKDVLKILNDDTSHQSDLENLHYVISKRLNQKINVLYTFEQAKLYNGDTLIIE